jgi:hypothetical protein
VEDGRGFAHLWRDAQRRRGAFLASWFSQLLSDLKNRNRPAERPSKIDSDAVSAEHDTVAKAA